MAFYRIHYEAGENIGRYFECFPVDELPALARLVERTLKATLELRSEQSD